ncbi:unnamed protein product [Ambrosiozyma monospora]|uniref:Unnamed protein product n=1 Tax=Ambrosiozyma monospora TaxID=43982 RepID=A0ACB5TB20_AMBMO|nr:unnamed protein product [Ambrosiozyma monospora]
MLKQCQVIGQVDKKFILIKLKVPNIISSTGTSSASDPCHHHHHHHSQQEENMTNFEGQKALVILDQHATDERINVEKMYREIVELTVLHQRPFGDSSSDNVEKKTKLDEPLTIKLGIEETEQMVRFESTLNCWGIQFQFDTTTHTDSNYADDGGFGAGCFNSDAFDNVGDDVGDGQEMFDVDKLLNVDQLISITHLPPLISNRIKRDSVLLRNGIREFLDELSTKKKQEYFMPQYQPGVQEGQGQGQGQQHTQSQSQSESPITATSTTTATTTIQSYTTTTTSSTSTCSTASSSSSSSSTKWGSTTRWTNHLSNMPELYKEIIKSKACRSSIMFGDELSKETCVLLVDKLSSCEDPFRCAHGRPSFVPLCSLAQIDDY